MLSGRWGGDPTHRGRDHPFGVSYVFSMSYVLATIKMLVDMSVSNEHYGFFIGIFCIL